MNRIRFWPPRHDDHSDVLIGAVGRPACVLANDGSTRIDREQTREERSIARVQGQMTASYYTYIDFDYLLRLDHYRLQDIQGPFGY